MAKEESKSGLLSKVARFVRHPTVSWSDLENLQPESHESQYSKQALKQMLERKRQNDFVRKREFDQLRKIRQAQLAKTAVTAATVAAAAETATRLSASTFLPTAQHSMPGERAETIKKIDAIEAQMARQWWQGQQAAGATTIPLELPAALTTSSAPVPDGSGAILSDPLVDDCKLSHPGVAKPAAGLGDSLLPDGASDCTPDFAPTQAATAASMVAPSMARFEHDAALEDAAIVFASGDNAAAETCLKTLIAERAQDMQAQLPVWLALLDMYRATGKQLQFEDAAMDFVARFGRSAPQWFAVPQQPAKLVETASDPLPTGFRWTAPVQLSVSSLRALLVSKARSPAPWVMDWSALETLDPAVRTLLLEAVQQWTAEQGRLIFAGHARLLAVLSQQTPSGEPAIERDWWHLRLAMLRLMHRQDDFELTALDYCVTYEQSPPPWVDPVCGYADEGQDQTQAFLDSQILGAETIQPQMLWQERKPRFALQGVIDGDALPWLSQVQGKVRLGETIAIDCTRLVRMDFAAAGSVLNWAAQMQQLGHVLQFSQLHQLLAVFFNVVGIQEHAQVIPRRD